MHPRILTVVLAAAVVTGTRRSALADDVTATGAPTTTISAARGASTEDAPGEEAEPTTAPPRPAGPAWYGWQTLLVDGVALGTVPIEVGTGASFTNTPSASYLLLASLTTYTLGAPVLHAAHGHWRRGALDLGLRAGAVALGGLAGAAAGGSPTSCDGRLAGCLGASHNGLLAGAAIGAALASVVDASFLTWETRPAEAGQASTLTVSPLAQMGAKGGVVGVLAEF